MLHVFIIFVFSDLSAQNSFIENKGQFPKEVKAKIDLPAGSLFIEEGRLRYAFYSSKQLSLVHDLHRANKNIEAHSYEVDFINSNTDIPTELLEAGNYYENYYLGHQSRWAKNVRSYKSVLQKNVYKMLEWQ